MPIPNLPSLAHKIARGAEGGHEFARICSMLLASEYDGYFHFLELINDGAGDIKKADARLRLIEYDSEPQIEHIVLFQFKFFSSPLSSDHRKRVKRALFEALDANSDCTKWVLITPDDFNRHDAEWFTSLRSEYLTRAGKEPPPIEHWGHTHLIAKLIQHIHIGRRYYPEIDAGTDIGVLRAASRIT